MTRLISVFILAAVLFILIYYSVFIQVISPGFSEGDEYYHIRVASFIKEYGPRYNFHWAKFSTFRKYYSDKEFLFHLFSIPFLFFSRDIMTAGKFAIIFYNILFILTLYFILKKYLPNFLIAVFLLLPFLNYNFLVYFLKLRPVTLANIFTILGIYFLIKKKWISVLILTVLYSVAHISFFTIVIFALICEYIRFRFKEGFFIRNVYAVIIGALLGFLLHPNSPHNAVSIYLNAMLVPFYSSIDSGIRFGREFGPWSTRNAALMNFMAFFILYGSLLGAFIYRIRLKSDTYVWFACSSFYLALSFLSIRYWYITDFLLVIFFASLIKDLIDEGGITPAVPKIRFLLFTLLLAIILFFPKNMKLFQQAIKRDAVPNIHFKNVAGWMAAHIPAGETVYHALWSDSAYLIGLNPNNNYMVVLDPIYMLYAYPKLYLVYDNLLQGKVKKPYNFLKKMLKINYGYTDKTTGIYRQVKEDKKHFSVLYDDGMGIVFKIL